MWRGTAALWIALAMAGCAKGADTPKSPAQQAFDDDYLACRKKASGALLFSGDAWLRRIGDCMAARGWPNSGLPAKVNVTSQPAK